MGPQYFIWLAKIEKKIFSLSIKAENKVSLLFVFIKIELFSARLNSN